MSSAIAVLCDVSLMGILTEFQHGIPYGLNEVLKVAESAFTYNIGLNNLPLHYLNTPYLQLFQNQESISMSAIFLGDEYDQPTLPLHLSILGNNLNYVKKWIEYYPQWLSPAPLNLAAICGHLDIVRLLVRASRDTLTSAALEHSARNGHLEVVQWIHGLRNGSRCTKKIIDGAASYGHLNVLKFLFENQTERSTVRGLSEAICNGYIDVVEYLFNHGCALEENAIFKSSRYSTIGGSRYAPNRNYLRVIEFLNDSGYSTIPQDLIYNSLEDKTMETLSYIHKHTSYSITLKMVNKLIQLADPAAIRYALEIVLIQNNKPTSLLDGQEQCGPWVLHHLPTESRYRNQLWWFSESMDLAAKLGDLKTLQLLHHINLTCCSSKAMGYAIETGRLDIIQWLHTNRTEGCTENNMDQAVEKGNLKIVMWLHENRGYNYTTRTFELAVGSGNEELVQHLLSHFKDSRSCKRQCGVEISQSTLDACKPLDVAASKGHLNIVKMLSQFDATTNAMDGAVKVSNFELVQYLKEQRDANCTHTAFAYAIGNNRLDILKYLIENKCIVGRMFYELGCVEAAGTNNFEMITYCFSLVSHDISFATKEKMMFKAACRQHLDTIKWLHQTHRFISTPKVLELCRYRGYRKLLKYFDAHQGDCASYSTYSNRGGFLDEPTYFTLMPF